MPEDSAAPERGQPRLRTSPWMIVITLIVPAVLAGCTGGVDAPDQAQFEPLNAVAKSQGPVARLYLAPTRTFGSLTTHCWFVVKEEGADTFNRWEVSLTAAQPYGYVRKNIRPPEWYVGDPPIYIWAELTGEEARPVVEFINEESPHYPYWDFYFPYPGPNCNTYIQWVLNETAWDVDLPPTAMGKNVLLTPPDTR